MSVLVFVPELVLEYVGGPVIAFVCHVSGIVLMCVPVLSTVIVFVIVLAPVLVILVIVPTLVLVPVVVRALTQLSPWCKQTPLL